MSLQLSKKVLKFQFNDENTDMSVIQQITVTNYGNASAFFTWQHPSNVFIPSPLSDEVPPGKSKQVQITFNPPGPKVDDEILLLKIKDGATEELRC